MAKEIELEIKSIIGELTEVNSKNEQKVVALASWNGRPDTIDIRRYNVSDDILTKGISLTPEEAGELIYVLLASAEVKYDRQKVYDILKEQEELEVDVEKLVSALPEGVGTNQPDLVDTFEEVTYGNSRRKVARCNRIIPKKDGLFSHLFKN